MCSLMARSGATAVLTQSAPAAPRRTGALNICPTLPFLARSSGGPGRTTCGSSTGGSSPARPSCWRTCAPRCRWAFAVCSCFLVTGPGHWLSSCTVLEPVLPGVTGLSVAWTGAHRRGVASVTVPPFVGNVGFISTPLTPLPCEVLLSSLGVFRGQVTAQPGLPPGRRSCAELTSNPGGAQPHLRRRLLPACRFHFEWAALQLTALPRGVSLNRLAALSDHCLQ